MIQASSPYVSSGMASSSSNSSNQNGSSHPTYEVAGAGSSQAGTTNSAGGQGGPWMRYRPSLRPATTPSPALLNVTGAAGSMSHPHHSCTSQHPVDHHSSNSAHAEGAVTSHVPGSAPLSHTVTSPSSAINAAAAPPPPPPPPLFGIGSLGTGRSQPLAPSLTTTTTNGEALTSPYSPKRRAAHLSGPRQRHDAQQLRSHASNGEVSFALNPEFSKDAENRGNVKITCGGVRFYLHKDVLYYASPFFRGLLQGGWSENEVVCSDEDDALSTTATEPCSELQHSAQPAPTSDVPTTSERISSQARLLQPSASSREAESPLPLAQRDTTIEASQGDKVDGELSLPSPRGHASPRASFHTAHHSLLDSNEDDARRPQEHDREALDAQDATWTDEAETASGARPAQQEGSRDIDALDVQGLSNRLQNLATPSSSPQLKPRRAISSADSVPAQRAPVRVRNSAPPLQSPSASSRARPSSLTERRARRTSSRRSRGSREDSHPSISKHSLVADVHLPDEDASTFQDVLCHIYPHLQLLVTWYNIGALMRFDDKYQIPFLRRSCISFLRAALAGRPIEAMALGERHGLEAEYKEASRHVLDNMPSWSLEELNVLSKETLLKLERKRIWFLERILKLSLANPARDYECHAACPDPKACAKSLGERWQAAYQASTRYGPPQPSVVWRHLRELEGTGGQPVAACHRASQAWVQLLFDRMFSITVGLSGTRPQPKFLSIKLVEGAGR
ncbi:DCD (DEVELOPMENT AND CELL DEATH) DOMAIN PROTEIN [Ceraceosorus bombacis]|uniref:DCD (DEVELOPMENT AND CELL DEATH) DOMAIN PROTEIN n=1 Tax=Ceraceosorus bombacis TaxID=401625 RepID=A0A0P1BDF7_9BASI|nr:DCD (DEVELOPMENT AND CELL DEATH) DOMAIN PROTEIN [Ceraceosorus bombacis]